MSFDNSLDPFVMAMMIVCINVHIAKAHPQTLKDSSNCNGGSRSDVINCCTKDNPCGAGQGHCREDMDCMGNFVCGRKNCDRSKFPWNRTRCCEADPVFFEDANTYGLQNDNSEKKCNDCFIGTALPSDACLGSLQLATIDDFELKPARKWPRSHFRRGRLSIAKVYGSCCFKLYSGLRRTTLIETLDANDQVYYSDDAIKSIERIQCSGK